MIKPSEYLKQSGWKPVRPEAHPEETRWVDPKEKRDMVFIEAYLTQALRDRAKKEGENVTRK